MAALLTIDHGRKGEADTSSGATAIIQAEDDGGLNQDVSNRDGERWLGFRSV